MTKEMKKKIGILIVGIVLAIAIGGLLIWFLMKPEKGATNTAQTNKEETELKDDKETSDEQGSGTGGYICDCDSLDRVEEDRSVYVVTEEGKFKQGTGAFCNAETADVFASVKLEESVDVSAFKAGYLHLSYFVSSKQYFTKNLFFEISSSGKADQDELGWEIALSTVQEGWNEIYLSVPDAGTTGKIDLSKVNYFRFYSPSINRGTGSLDVIIDDIYMTKSTGGAEVIGGGTGDGEGAKVPEDSYKETSAKEGIMIASCNTMNIFSQMKNLEVTTKSGQHVEGSGAMKIVNGSSASFMLKESLDISQYMTQEGKLRLSLYISDVSLLTGNVNFFLSNVDDRDDAMMYWAIDNREFHNGWNNVELDFFASWMHRPINAKEVKYFSFVTSKPSGEMTLILDNIHVTEN